LNARFIPSNFQEKELLNENAYDVFEPTLKFEIEGRDVFKVTLGLVEGLDKVVVFHFMESALRQTRNMIANLGRNSGKDYNYWFLGTGYGLQAIIWGKSVRISLVTDPDFGPVKRNTSLPRKMYLGEITVIDWVNCVVALSKQLEEMASHVNPKLRRILLQQERERTALEGWMESFDD
jgi:hypothetical protein